MTSGRIRTLLKVRVERHNDCISSQRECENLPIGGSHPDLAHVHTLMSDTLQKGGPIAGTAQTPQTALPSVAQASRLLAANAKACLMSSGSNSG